VDEKCELLVGGRAGVRTDVQAGEGHHGHVRHVGEAARAVVDRPRHVAHGTAVQSEHRLTHVDPGLTALGVSA
jgi:hypothetical protein